MGHTLVTKFDENGLEKLHKIMDPFQTNKIPFGRNCNREHANSVLDYHVTVFHWAKDQDEIHIRRLNGFTAPLCQIEITGVSTMHAEEGSLLLYLTAIPAQGFLELVEVIENRLCVNCSDFIHVTLAVSKDHEEIELIKKQIREAVRFPFRMNVIGLDLYHIWNPTKWVRTF